MTTIIKQRTITTPVRQLQLINPTPEYFGHKIRVLVDTEMNNAPWFVGSDILKTLEMKGGSHLAYRKLFESEKSYRERITVGMKAGRPIMLVSESGFYKLVMRSNKAEAEAFQHWVCSEVLPSIRKYGQYAAYADEDNNPIDIPEVMVEMVRLNESLPNNAGITETAPRVRIYEWVIEQGIEGLSQQQRSALGKIARRLLHTHGLTPMRLWKPYKKPIVGKIHYGPSGAYPESILDLAYQEFLKGMKD